MTLTTRAFSSPPQYSSNPSEINRFGYLCERERYTIEGQKDHRQDRYSETGKSGAFLEETYTRNNGTELPRALVNIQFISKMHNGAYFDLNAEFFLLQTKSRNLRSWKFGDNKSAAH